MSKHYGIRTERHKLIVYADGPSRELYDLWKDPSEVNNLYHDPDCADLVAEMERKLRRAIEEVGIAPDQLPGVRADERAAEPKKNKRPRKSRQP